MHYWKDSSGMPLSSVVATLMVGSKTGPLDDPIELEKKKKITVKDQVNMKFVPDDDVPHGQELPDAQYIQFGYFLDMPKSPILNFQILFHIIFRPFEQSNRQSAYTTYLTRSTFISVLLVEGLPLLKSSFTSSWPSLNLLCNSKARVRDMLLSPYICFSITSACDRVIPNRTNNFRFIRSSVLKAERKRRCK